MRKNIAHRGSKELSYEIREIVEVAKKVATFGVDIIWENIGDPVKKGEKVPNFLKDIVQEELNENMTYAYSPTKGLDLTREYLAKNNDKITSEDIIFFNGLGEAISKVYSNLSPQSRIIGPNPAYSTHSSFEAAHTGDEHITYKLDPNNNWNPDLEDIENKVKYNPNVVGIIVINPDNPTGAVFSKNTLEKIVEIAKEYDLFLIFDEIYENLVYNNEDKVLLKDIIGEVPGIAMKGISKDLPWPGSRCGWIEIYNKEKDALFGEYVDAILNSKMLEVCSTTLPQKIIPKIYSSEKFEEYISLRKDKYSTRADLAIEILGDLEELQIVKPKGAFYLTILLTDNFNKSFELNIENKSLKNYIDSLTLNQRLDKRFCYELLASTGLCVVPLSGFNSELDGFRMTLLEEDLEKYKTILKTIRKIIEEIRK